MEKKNKNELRTKQWEKDDTVYSKQVSSVKQIRNKLRV